MMNFFFFDLKRSAACLFVTVLLMQLLLCGLAHADCRIVAIGDLHGDLENAQKVLRTANVIDRNNRWIAGCSTLVQTGDIVDRGLSSLDALDYFRSLQREASRMGGEVIMLLGNHELLNFEGTTNYVHPEEIARYGGASKWRALFQPGGAYRKWLEELDVVAVVNGTVFVHAGILPSYAGLGVSGINRMFRVQLKRKAFGVGVLGDEGPLWTRQVIQRAMSRDCTLVDMSLELLGARQMVVGHTIQSDFQVHSYCKGKLIAIDVAISRAISGSHPGCVEFVDGVVVPIYA